MPARSWPTSLFVRCIGQRSNRCPTGLWCKLERWPDLVALAAVMEELSRLGSRGRLPDLAAAELTDFILAVRVRFELTEPVKVQRFSRPPDSTKLSRTSPRVSIHI